MSQQQQIIQAGDTVIITGNDNKSYTIHHNIQPSDVIKLHKGVQISAKELIHQPFYAFYRVNYKSPSSKPNNSATNNNTNSTDTTNINTNTNNNTNKNEQQLTLLSEHPDPEPLYCQEESKEDMQKDNRGIVDDNRAQNLTSQQIDEMKRAANSDPNAIIHQLVSHSASFAQKNNFSQQKYLKKKKQKYMTIIKVVPPTIHEMCRVYMEKKPDKISYLRFDALAQLLYMGNVYSNSQVMIVETCMGLLTAAALERMSGYGRILKIAENNNHHIHCAKILNRNVPTRSVIHPEEPMIYYVPFSMVAKLDTTCPEQQQQQQQQEQQENQSAPSEEQALVETLSTSGNDAIEQKKLEKQKQKEELEQRIVLLLKAKSDSLIIAGDGYDPESILVKLWPYLQSSGTFAIFCPYMQPLQQCYNMLRAKKNGMHACMVTLTETWTREQQVLPLRTHPVMRMHATSGFILSGIKID